MDTPNLPDPSKLINARRELFFKSKWVILKTEVIPPLYATTDETVQAQRSFLFWLIAMDRLYSTSIQLADEQTIFRTIGSMVRTVLLFINTFLEELADSDNTDEIDDLANDIDLLMARARVTYDTDVEAYYDIVNCRELFYAVLLFLDETFVAHHKNLS